MGYEIYWSYIVTVNTELIPVSFTKWNIERSVEGFREYRALNSMTQFS